MAIKILSQQAREKWKWQHTTVVIQRTFDLLRFRDSTTLSWQHSLTLSRLSKCYLTTRTRIAHGAQHSLFTLSLTAMIGLYPFDCLTAQEEIGSTCQGSQPTFRFKRCAMHVFKLVSSLQHSTFFLNCQVVRPVCQKSHTLQTAQACFAFKWEFPMVVYSYFQGVAIGYEQNKTAAASDWVGLTISPFSPCFSTWTTL